MRVIARGGRRVPVRMCVDVSRCRCKCRCKSAAEHGDGFHFIVVLGNHHDATVVLRGADRGRALGEREGIAEELRVDAEYEGGVDGLARATDLGRVVVEGVEVLQDVVERALGDVLPFVDEEHVGVLRLHAGCDARVFVARKVLRIDHGDDRIQREGARGLALELADLECESCGEGGTAVGEIYASR